MREYREGRAANEHMRLITQSLMGTVDAHTGLFRAPQSHRGEWQRVSWDTEAFVSSLRELGMNSATLGQQKAPRRKPSGSRYCLLASMQRERESGRKKCMLLFASVCVPETTLVTIRSANLKRLNNPKRTQAEEREEGGEKME